MSNPEASAGGDAVPQSQPSGAGGSPPPAASSGSGCSRAAGVVFVLAGLGMFLLYDLAELSEACYPDEYSTGFCGLDFFVLVFGWTLVGIGVLIFIMMAVSNQRKAGKS